MNFFVNQYLVTKNSSIEHAELKRLALFNGHEPGSAKLLTQDFAPTLDQTLERFGLQRDAVINMYDFFAGTTDYVGAPLKVDGLAYDGDLQMGTGNNFRELKRGGRLVSEVHFIGGTVAQVGNVDYFDDAGNLTLRQIYDLRGFLAVNQYYGRAGELFYERYQRPDGTVYLERYYVQSTENTPINSLNVLKDYQGRDRFFYDQEGLFTFFLDEVNRAFDENNRFFADRPAVAINPILNMTSKVKRYLWLAMRAVDDGQDLATGSLDTMVDAAVQHGHKWTGVVVATAAQAADLKPRLPKGLKCYVVNNSPVKVDRTPILIQDRPAQRVIAVGRLGADKQTDQLIDLFARVHTARPKATLTFYGYGNQADMQSYQERVKAANLEQVVTFADYVVDLEPVYDQASLLVDASRVDAQPLAMAEALSHGVPVVSYDYAYGPSELVIPGQTGELVPLGNRDAFVKAVIDLLSDPTKLQDFSTAAYQNLTPFSEATTWQQWQALK